MIGKHISHYEILESLGAGAMGSVYRARDDRLGREVAIKFLSPGAADDAERVQRFFSEARLASSLNHPNIISVFDIGECDEGPYLVTELVEGRTLQELIAHGRPPLNECVRIIQQVADGLAKAHGAGIVHRDLKPANIMVSSDGLVKILDFGLAKLHGDAGILDADAHELNLTQTGTVVGTAAYMPPERLYGAEADARSDVFSLAVLSDELLHRRHPFVKDSMSETLRAILKEEPQRPPELKGLLPEGLAELLQTAMAKEPGDRHEDAGAFADELRAWSTASMSYSASGRFRTEREQRHPGFVLGIAAALILVVAVALWTRSRAPRVDAPAENMLRVAVLPASDQTGDAELREARLDRILADVFVHSLTDLEGIQVVSPLRLDNIARGRGRDMEEAVEDFEYARELSESAGATAILHSNVARVGGDFVLTATMTDLASEEVLGTFKADSSDPARLLSDMSADLAEAFGKQFEPRDSTAGMTSGLATPDMRAYTHYVMGRDHIGVARWREAREEFQAAVELDPQMGLAWSELGCAYSFLGEDEALVEAAQAEAEKWVEGLSRKDRWWIELNGTWQRTENGHAYIRQIERFLEEYPDDREAHFYAGLAAQWLNGNCREALGWFDRAYELTPFYYPITKGLVDCHTDLGEQDEAVAALERYLELKRAPSHGREWARQRLAAFGGSG